MVALSALLLARLHATTPLRSLVVSYIIFGIGFGLVNAPITNTAVSGMPRAQAGLAAAVASTSRQVGAALGVAIGGTIASTAAAVGARAEGPGFSTATHAFWWLVVANGALVFALGVVSNSRWARGSAQRIAARFDEAAAPRAAS